MRVIYIMEDTKVIGNPNEDLCENQMGNTDGVVTQTTANNSLPRTTLSVHEVDDRRSSVATLSKPTKRYEFTSNEMNRFPIDLDEGFTIARKSHAKQVYFRR